MTGAAPVLLDAGQPLLRLARQSDVPAMEALIARSGIVLSAGFYTPEQAEAVTRHVFGVDSQLVEDGTYYLIEQDGSVVACGGWSKRNTLFGGDQAKRSGAALPDSLLDPAVSAARIRAFFVAPGMERRGLGRQLLRHCSEQAALAGFRALELAATMPGVPLYRAAGFMEVEAIDLTLPGDIAVPLLKMRREIP
jgi:N-acetylglutamate synthase-like GNAT family acetyltransferase